MFRCPVLAVLLLVCTLQAPSPAWAASADGLAQVEQLRALAEQDNDAALTALLHFHKELPADAPYKLRLEALRALIGLLYDAGRAAEVNPYVAELEALAQRHGDQEMLMIGRVVHAWELLDAGKPVAMLEALEQIRKSLPQSAGAEVRMRLAVAAGAAHQTLGQYDQALADLLEALRLSEGLSQRRDQQRMLRLQALGELYIAMHNPEKALEVFNQALAVDAQGRWLKLDATLARSRAAALAELGRLDEAQQAFEIALKHARAGKVAVLEAALLVDSADLMLRRGQFAQAERLAREGLALAERIDDKYTVWIARANIGFALGGQGRVREAQPMIERVIGHFREAQSVGDVEALLGETSQMYERVGLYREALAAVREQQKFSAQLFRSDREKAVAALQEQFGAEQRKKEIELLERRAQLQEVEIRNHQLRQVVASLGALLALLVGAFVYRLYRRVKQANADLEAANRQLEFHSVRDPLTGLFNRRSFHELMGSRPVRIERERRESQLHHPDSLLLLDIDHFKPINDSHGHAAGDAVLIEVSRRLRQAVRDTDMVMRWGGEEFLIYSPKTPIAQLTALVERVLQAIGGEPIGLPDGKQLQVTVSGGFISVPFTDLPESRFDWEKAMQLADMALYLGKLHGRNRAYGIERLLVDADQGLPVLEADLSMAIEKGIVALIEVNGPRHSTLEVAPR